MDYTTLGRTGLKVSVLGLGAGGHSRLGQATGKTREESVRLAQRALDLGITFIDTAEAYGTEPLVGEALRGRREAVTVSTKKNAERDGVVITPDELRRGLDDSLSRLGTDVVDIYHMHGVAAQHYDYVRDELVPVLRALREAGKIRFVGITEAFASDTEHRMMARAAEDDCWDVVMVGFNILNQSARERVLPHTLRQDIGVLDMFAVRRALSQPEKLRQTVSDLVAQGVVDGDTVDAGDPLGLLLHDAGAVSLTDAGYRFCRA